ncbi:MAG: DUF4231 domain-containing protein [Acidimicrobiales bacterium]
MAASIGRKADKAKRRARRSVIGLTLFSAAIPALIGLSGTSWIVGKLFPSLCALISIFITSWVQLERPHERWVLYRRYHRLLESETERFKYKTDGYAQKGDDERATILGKFVADLQVDLQYEWEGLIPRSDQVAAAGNVLRKS